MTQIDWRIIVNFIPFNFVVFASILFIDQTFQHFACLSENSRERISSKFILNIEKHPSKYRPTSVSNKKKPQYMYFCLQLAMISILFLVGWLCVGEPDHRGGVPWGPGSVHLHRREPCWPGHHFSLPHHHWVWRDHPPAHSTGEVFVFLLSS